MTTADPFVTPSTNPRLFMLIPEGAPPRRVELADVAAAYPDAPTAEIDALALRSVFRGTGYAVRRARYLYCCVCGQGAGTWAQHYNRDDGYGLCEACAKRLPASGTSAEEMASLYGTAGVNYPAIEPSERKAPGPALVNLGDVHPYPHANAAWLAGDATWFQITESRYMPFRLLLPLLTVCALSTSACETSRIVKVPTPVVIVPPPCVGRPPPLPPEVPAGVSPSDDAGWATYYVNLVAWSWASWRACRAVSP